MALIFLYTAAVSIYFCLRRQKYAQDEYWLVICVSVCVPLLLVRVLYSVIFVITADMTWNAVKGSSSPYLLMTMLPEVAFIAMCTFTIAMLRPMAEDKRTNKDQRSQKGEEGPANVV